MILVIASEKGGVGKSTIALNLAVRRAQDAPEGTLLIDCDRQMSVTKWASIRDLKNIPIDIPTIQLRGNKIYKDINSLSKKYDSIIIDVGGMDSDEMRAAMGVADRVLIPVQCTALDVFSTQLMAEMVATSKIQNHKLKASVVISQQPTNPSLKQDITDTIEFLQNDEWSILENCPVSYRVAYNRSIAEGKGVVELDAKNDKDRKAAKEIEDLYNSIPWEC